MRILIVHSKYLSAASGENRVVEDEALLLRSGGHDVQVLARSPRPEQIHGARLLRTGLSSVWSVEAAGEIDRLVRRERIDVVHFHNLFPSFSPSALAAARRGGAAVVMTLHNYRLLCLPATFLRQGNVCEQCLGHVPWRGVRHRCYRGSMLGSAALASSLTVGRLRRAFDHVTFIAVSDFVRRKHILAGFPEARLRVKPNFVPALPQREGAGEFFLYLGRLAPEKDLRLLIDSWRPDLGRLVIAGDGPDAEELRPLGVGRGVEFLGSVASEEVGGLLARARALMFPSKSFEGMPRAVLEAYAAGVPVIASDVGALPEIIMAGETGLLVPPHPEAWANAMARLGDDSEARRLGQGARDQWRDHYSPERGLPNLVGIYRDALEGRLTSA